MRALFFYAGLWRKTAMTKDFIEGFAIGIVSGGIAVWLMVLVWFAVVSIHAPAWGATLGIIPDFARFV